MGLPTYLFIQARHNLYSVGQLSCRNYLRLKHIKQYNFYLFFELWLDLRIDLDDVTSASIVIYEILKILDKLHEQIILYYF